MPRFFGPRFLPRTQRGSFAAFIVSRAPSSVLYDTSPHDVRVFLAAPLILAVLALAATLVPALRATRWTPSPRYGTNQGGNPVSRRFRSAQVGSLGASRGVTIRSAIFE